ncbi:phosphoribosylaminoimidazole synthetase [Streptococcus sanguinis SK1056]|uniref:Phosphoribosylaminoimidazole synthetase n=1 Tax=Streptococcus sanguinis SK1056 TaxID=888820 RepID=F3UDQ8_STRSA|nr:phosphoribosylaminoimidazole synthetase [Streptococcus sanguinis SK1056]
MIFISLLLYLELQKGTDLGADLKEAIGCQTSSLSHFNIQHFFLKKYYALVRYVTFKKQNMV